METLINAKTLRSQLAQVVERVRKGERFTVLYRSRPVCRIVPISAAPADVDDAEGDSLYRSPPVGRSADGLTAADHDLVLYGRKSK